MRHGTLSFDEKQKLTNMMNEMSGDEITRYLGNKTYIIGSMCLYPDHLRDEDEIRKEIDIALFIQDYYYKHRLCEVKGE